MATTMHRLQISLPEWQAQFLAERARRDGVSIAEVMRRLVEREAEVAAQATAESLWEIAGIAEDRGPLAAGLERYRSFVESEFAGYLETRARFYGEVVRFSDRDFWQRRHRNESPRTESADRLS